MEQSSLGIASTVSATDMSLPASKLMPLQQTSLHAQPALRNSRWRPLQTLRQSTKQICPLALMCK
jgi:hypothetical protein